MYMLANIHGSESRSKKECAVHLVLKIEIMLAEQLFEWWLEVSKVGIKRWTERKGLRVLSFNIESVTVFFFSYISQLYEQFQGFSMGGDCKIVSIFYIVYFLYKRMFGVHCCYLWRNITKSDMTLQINLSCYFFFERTFFCSSFQ